MKLASLQTGEVFAFLDSSPDGLNRQEILERQQNYGENLLQTEKRKPLLVKFVANFTHLMAILLWVGGMVAFIARMPELAVAVWLVNIINGAFSFWQEFRAEKASEELRKLLPTYTRVLRDGQETRILAEELVPGDVVLFAEGEKISADCRLVEQAAFRVDQSTLTGESRPVGKSADASVLTEISVTEQPNLVFAGTSVAAGTAKGIVYAIAMQTEFGKIAHLTQTMKEELSPLQIEMQSITKTVSIIAVLVGTIFFVLAYFLAPINLAESFIFGLGMIVAFVPEGLLPTVTLALAMGTQRMAKRNALVKKLSAVETLGCTTVICTDKTGTLTQNEMTVRRLWVPESEHGAQGKCGTSVEVSGIGYNPLGEFYCLDHRDTPVEVSSLRGILRAILLCNNARLISPQANETNWHILGDPTEAALKVVAAKAGISEDDELIQYPRILENPFDSRRKRMSTIHLDKSGNQRSAYSQSPRVAFVKGAPKELLDLCTRVDYSGRVIPLTLEIRKAAMEENDAMARDGLRVLAVAIRYLPKELEGQLADEVEQDLIFLGLVAMMDPPREEISMAVQKCNQAGIRVIMITGDYGLTAESIARRVGIIHSANPRIITGFDLDRLSDQELEAAFSKEVIFARVSPEHKLRVVMALQELGNIVAVTGDGVNDAPALKRANIGVAMGITGSDVAKEAADMILMDDNFASIVNAVEEGRAVYANIKKFTTYIFTSNTPEAVPFILYAFSAARIPLALNVMHILAVDLGTDIVPALALGAEPPEPGTMQQPPRNLDEHVITPKLLRRAYLLLGPLQSFAVMAAFYYYYWTNGYAGQWLNLPASGAIYHSATAMALAAVVTTQIGNLFAQRAENTPITRMPWLNNKLVWIGILSELIVIAAIVYVPLFHRFIGTASFSLGYWPFLFAWSPLLMVADEVRKMIQWKKAPKRADQGGKR
ncbi:MAG: cation-transporting P-type ATPase [Chloroflexi bacterium]|nr:cation-transporting P-type ATPase [Chloroflexota bacterium]